MTSVSRCVKSASRYQSRSSIDSTEFAKAVPIGLREERVHPQREHNDGVDWDVVCINKFLSLPASGDTFCRRFWTKIRHDRT